MFKISPILRLKQRESSIKNIKFEQNKIIRINKINYSNIKGCDHSKSIGYKINYWLPFV